MGERLSESHSNEFRQRSHRSEFTKSTQVPTQLTIRTNESEDTIYESTLQQYPVHDIEPSSPSASRPMQQNSKVTSKERRQNDQVGFQHDDSSRKRCKVILSTYLFVVNAVVQAPLIA